MWYSKLPAWLVPAVASEPAGDRQTRYAEHLSSKEPKEASKLVMSTEEALRVREARGSDVETLTVLRPKEGPMPTFHTWLTP